MALIDRMKVFALLEETGGSVKEVACLMGIHINTVQAIKRKDRRACVRCLAPAVDGKTMCSDCLKSDAARIKETRKQRRHEGVCIECGASRQDGSRFYCVKHRDNHMKRNAAYFAKIKRKGVVDPVKKRRRTLEHYGKAGLDAWERDSGTCQVSKIPHGEMTVHIHHIDEDRTNNTLENFACLCFDCHRAVHRLLASKDRIALIAWFERTYPDQPLR